MPDQETRRSSGGMYDPARDSWGDRSGDRDEPQLHHESEQAQPRQDQSGRESGEQAATQVGRLFSVRDGAFLPIRHLRISSCLDYHFSDLIYFNLSCMQGPY